MDGSASLLSIAGIFTLAGALALGACQEEPSGPPPITDVPGAIEAQADLITHQCQCTSPFDERTVEECVEQAGGVFSDNEVVCLTGVFEDDPASFEVLKCEAEAYQGLLACQQAEGCPGAFDCGGDEIIPDTWVCDGLEDCADGSDEHEGCGNRCSDGKLLEPRWICDQYPDCLDGSDETGCRAPLKCGDGQEVPGGWVCDGTIDCPDGSDEEQDCPPLCVRPWLLQLSRCGFISQEVLGEIEECFEFTCLDGTVIESGRVCDGVEDCSEGADEVFCGEDPTGP